MRKMPIVAGMVGLAAIAGAAYALQRRRKKNTLRGRVDDAVRETGDQASRLRETAAGAVASARETAGEAISTAQERVVDLKEKAQERFEEMRENASNRAAS